MKTIIDVLVSYGVYGIIIAAFCEAIFMPVPMELISIPVYLANPSMAFLYSIILIAFSITGSIGGYHMGKLLGKPLLEKLSSVEYINKLKKLYEKNAFLTVLTSSFTPIPYEVYALSAGVFNIGLNKFIPASIISRVIRHLPQGILIHLFGKTLLDYIQNYTLIAGLFVFVIVLLFRYSSSNSKKKTRIPE